MNRYRRIVRRRLTAALGLRRPKTAVVPVLDQPIATPSEIVDLDTGPYLAHLRDRTTDK